MAWNSQGGGGWNTGNRGPWGQGPNNSNRQPDLDDLIRQAREMLKGSLPPGSLGSRSFALFFLIIVAFWAATGFYRVNPDEQGVVTRFGAVYETTQPGLNYHLPWPIDSVQTPAVLRVNRVDIGFRALSDAARADTMREVPEESLMLTGDENIVDIDFAVLWVIADAPSFLFNVQRPELTVKYAAESAMREIIGRSQIQSVLTEGRQNIEANVQQLLQQILDSYGAGIRVTQVQMQKVDPPAAVIDAFRDVQAARSDLERARNEAEAYSNDVIPRARGEAAQIVQQAEAYKSQVVSTAQGEAQRFIKIYDEYKNARDITRQRMYFETMEKVLGDVKKVIVEPGAAGSSVMPYFPLGDLNHNSRTTPAPNAQTGASK
jgi:membrane protease subunit HflK